MSVGCLLLPVLRLLRRTVHFILRNSKGAAGSYKLYKILPVARPFLR